MESRDDFLAAERDRIPKRYKKAIYAAGFTSKPAFAVWYIDTMILQNYQCYYCATDILVIRKLIANKLVRTRKVRGEGVRGQVLEVDKRVNDSGYSPQNCVLSCYYCNNDKSYTCDDEAYKRYFGPNRNIYFMHLLSTLK